MEKTPMYAVVTPPHPCKRQWVAWVATGVSIIALVVACVTAAVAVQQVDRVTDLEERMLEMQAHMEEILRFTINNHDYLEYEDYANDSQLGPYEELTLQRVVRKKRQVDNVDDSAQAASVPIYDQAYGLNLRGGSKALRLYESLQATNGEGDPTSPEVTVESTDSPIKPHHRDGRLDPTGSIVLPMMQVSGSWVSKKRRQRYPPASGPELFSRAYVNRVDDDDDYDDEVVTRTTNRRSAVLQRGSRTKATSRHDGYSGPNSVTPQAPQKVVQKVPQKQEFLVRTVQTPVIDSRISGYKDGRKKKRPGTRQVRRRRRSRSAITVAHFVATPFNRTSRHGFSETHEEWSPAAWMDKLGLNRRYQLRRGVVTVRESGLYYLYAQVLYEPGRFGTGFQIEVDGIPIMQCTLAPTQPSHSCYTAGATYLPRNADVYVRDLEHHTSAVKRQENSFFGLMKLRDAPNTAEELLLG